MQAPLRNISVVLPQTYQHMRRRLYHSRSLTNAGVQKKRVELFDKEVKRQAALVTDIEKIEVKFTGQPEDCTLIMNKNVSTPYNCAQHMNQMIMDRTVLAEVNGQVWDMHRPLEDDCSLCFLHFRQADPFYANKAFWRSASVMLGAVLESAFKENIFVELCSFPSPNVRTGSFVYDVDLKIPSWTPNKEELRTLSGEMIKLAMAELPFHRLEVDASLALNMFADNRYKSLQIPQMAAQSPSGNTVVLYRMGSFLEISRGPMISNTSHMGKVSIVAVHPVTTNEGQLFRIQGVALPKGFMLNHYSYGILQKRAESFNKGRLPLIPAPSQIQQSTETAAV